MYMKLPEEMRHSPEHVARQVRCVYGTCDAGKLWKDTYTQAMGHVGLVAGIANPCVFYHKTQEITIVVPMATTLQLLGPTMTWIDTRLALRRISTTKTLVDLVKFAPALRRLRLSIASYLPRLLDLPTRPILDMRTFS